MQACVYNFLSKRGAITNPNKAIVSFYPFLSPKLEEEDAIDAVFHARHVFGGIGLALH